MDTNISYNKNVYICGPWYRENTHERYEEYLRLGGILIDREFTPIYPAFFGTDPLPRFEKYLKDTLGKILLCRYIYLMRGWQKNYAAAFEYVIARHAGIQVLCDEGELPSELDPCFPLERRDARTYKCEPGEELTFELKITDHYAVENKEFYEYYKQRILPFFTKDSDTCTADQRQEQTN